MNNLEIAKAIAKLEGVDVTMQSYGTFKFQLVSGNKSEIYNPITDLALNCMLRDKYEIDVDHYNGLISIASDYTARPPKAVVYFYEKEELPRAVCECILKANNLWAGE